MKLLLETAGDGGPRVVDELVPLVYTELHAMAHRLLRGQSHRSTLDTTALVHEAYLKLVGHQEIPARGRAYFFGAAARAMRQVLVDAARRRNRQVRGGGVRPITIDRVDPADPSVPDLDGEVLAVDRALTELARDYPRQAKVVECRYFGGLSIDETAEAIGVSARTVKRDGALAQAWLFRELSAGAR